MLENEKPALRVKVTIYRLKEVVRGRYHKDQGQGGTQETEASGAQESRPQGEAHHATRLNEEKSEEDGARAVEALGSQALYSEPCPVAKPMQTGYRNPSLFSIRGCIV
jgi:hypothetical protein